jgi:hypothetical protein
MGRAPRTRRPPMPQAARTAVTRRSSRNDGTRVPEAFARQRARSPLRRCFIVSDVVCFTVMIEVWPVALRARLVRAFRPGEPPKEAPFRTLRKHGWASSGVSIVCREHSHASGRLTVFSMLNVDAARLAREGRSREAVAFAKAAAKIEMGKAFAQLKAMVSGRPSAETAEAIQGTSKTQSPQLLAVLRLIARETQAARKRFVVADTTLQTVAGRISETLPDAVVLESSSQKTYVPRGLAESANRVNVGDLLALVTERLDPAQVAFEVLPAIAVENEIQTVSPFGRSAPIHQLTAADARLLRRDPAPLRVLVPVTVGK